MAGVNPRAMGIGRQKGTPNRKSQVLMDKCVLRDIDPFDELLMLVSEADINIRFQALKEICSYLYPKRRAVEVTGDLDVRLIERVKELSHVPRTELIKMAEAEFKKLQER